MHVNPPGLLGCASLKSGGFPCPKSPPARWGTRANPAGILAPALGAPAQTFSPTAQRFLPRVRRGHGGNLECRHSPADACEQGELSNHDG